MNKEGEMECCYTECKRPITKPRLCPSCKLRVYCSQECRLSDWYGGHQITCGLKEVKKVGEFRISDFVEEKDDNEDSILGKGSFGEVHLVTHQPSGQKYALKSVPPIQISKMILQREGSLDILKREITIHMNLSHPNIIRLYDHFEDQNKVYLLLELANRGSLFYEIHRQKRLQEDIIRRYFRQTCEGIRYLHENDIIHRDIKPENLLIDRENNIKICDFGWCVRSAETRTTFCGTLEYMAPEMILGGGHSFAIDIWALGVLLFEMAHGRAPFTGRTESDKCQQILTLTYQTDPELPPALTDLIHYMLKVTPEERPSISSVLSHPWLTSPESISISIGTRVRCCLPSHDWSEGEITEITGDSCAIQFDWGIETLPSAEVLKMILKKAGKMELNHPDEQEYTFNRAKEAELLRNIDEWCRSPKFSSAKSGFMSELEAKSKQLEESLAAIQLKKEEEKAGVEGGRVQRDSWEERGEKDEQREKEREILAEGVLPSETTSHAAPCLTSADLYQLTDEFSSPLDPVKISTLSIPENELSPAPILIPDTKPSFDQVPSKQLHPQLSISYDNSDAGLSASSPVLSAFGNSFNSQVSRYFEQEREQIDTRAKDFYQKAERKWMTHSSKPSIVEAPEGNSPLLPDKKHSRVIGEVEKLQNETRRPMPKVPLAKHKSEEIVKMNRELEARKQRISELMSHPGFHRSLVVKREHPRRQQGEDSSFFRWLGSVLGCTNR